MNEQKRKKWWYLLVTTSGTSLVFLDSTIMPVALPTIQDQFNFSNTSIIWVVNAYLLSLTALLLIGGRLSDIFGRRNLFIWGFSLFGFGSLIAAFSFSRGTLVLGRVIQGIGGAMTVPTTGALLMTHFPRGERARALGINTAISSIFLVTGPAVGGFLTQYLNWRSIFFVNLPLVLFGTSMALVILEKDKRKREPFHFEGAATMVIAIVCLVVGLMEGNNWGWDSYLVWLFLLLSPLFFIFFLWISTHVKHPLINMSFFQNRYFSLSNICIFFVQMVITVTVIWAIYFQEQLGYSPSQTGLIIFIAAFPVCVMAPLGGFLGDRLGPRIPLLIGFGLLTFALYWLLFTAHEKSIPILLPGLFSFGSGVPLIMSPTMALALSQVPNNQLGAASGVTVEVRQLASTIGIALMTAIFYTTLKMTGSSVRAFEAVSLIAGSLALVGFLVVLFGVRKHNGVS
ncbi:MAG: MFS transporter [Chlamydiales bacterium]